MKRILIFLILSIFYINKSFPNDFDIVARVNDKIITRYDLDTYSKMFKKYFKNNSELTPAIRREILNGLIDDTLKEEAIEREKIQFDQEEFEYYMDNIKTKTDISKYNIDQDIYIKTLKNNFLWNKLIETKIRPRVSVGNSEVNDSLEYLSDKPIRTRYSISQITLYKNQNSDPKAIADKLYDEIRSKNNFEYIAEKFSKENSKNKGYIGWVDEMDINKDIYAAIKNLQVGAISKPIYFGDTNSGYYMIIKLNDKKQERVILKDDIIRVQYFIYNQKLNLEIKNYMDNLYSTAFIEIL